MLNHVKLSFLLSQRDHIDNFTQFCLIIGFSVALDVGDKEKGLGGMILQFWLE